LIPGVNNVFTEGFDANQVVIDIDANGDGTFEQTNVVVPATGLTTTTPLSPDGVIRVRVIGTVTATTPNAPVTVRLGNTVPPGPQNAQNIASNGGVDAVRTVDVTTVTPGEVAGSPSNGEREAAATQTVSLGTASLRRALAEVLKTSLGVAPGQANLLTDDEITYRLDLNVENTSPSAQFTPGILEGTTLNVNGATTPPRILVSDAIPAGTVLDRTFTPALPPGWDVVYSTTPIDQPTDTALTAAWTTNLAAIPVGTRITRVGFIFTGTLAPGTTTANTANGFQFRVITSGLTAPGQIANIAQAFGQTQGDTTNGIVYDESGDQNPNNFNDDDSPRDPNGLGGPISSGIANPDTQGVDPNNNNTGQGPGGEDNTVNIGITPVGGILNGPNNQPGATGTDGTNQTDFTNRTVPLPPGTTDPFDPPAIAFTNTVNNPGTGRLDNVVIRPIGPVQADFVSDNTAGNQTDPNTGFGPLTGANALPNDTQVIITQGNRTATYNYANGTYTLVASTTGGTADTTPTAIRISIPAGTAPDYAVSVNLPDGTPQTQGFPIPIVSFVDQDNDGNFDRSQTTPNVEPIFNLTVDRVYTGYVRLVKTVRILAADGTTVIQDFTPNPTVNATSGQFLVYRIAYTNISTPPSNNISGSVLLNANDFALDENGAVLPNNWATTTTHQIGTVASQGTVQFFNGATPLGATDPASGSPVTRYIHRLGTNPLTPGETGTFTFRRRVN
jgi:hypothetical protein